MSNVYLRKGFTLIELLVVIAIIGILSSVVLASLSTARTKGKSTAVKSGLNSLRTQMELTSSAGNYGAGANGIGEDGCDAGTSNYTTDTAAAAIVTNIKANLSVSSNVTCSVNTATNATKFAVAALLPDSTGIQCTDTSGNTKFYSGITTLSTSQINDGACI